MEKNPSLKIVKQSSLSHEPSTTSQEIKVFDNFESEDATDDIRQKRFSRNSLTFIQQQLVVDPTHQNMTLSFKDEADESRYQNFAANRHLMEWRRSLVAGASFILVASAYISARLEFAWSTQSVHIYFFICGASLPILLILAASFHRQGALLLPHLNSLSALIIMWTSCVDVIGRSMVLGTQYLESTAPLVCVIVMMGMNVYCRNRFIHAITSTVLVSTCYCVVAGLRNVPQYEQFGTLMFGASWLTSVLCYEVLNALEIDF